MKIYHILKTFECSFFFMALSDLGHSEYEATFLASVVVSNCVGDFFDLLLTYLTYCFLEEIKIV